MIKQEIQEIARELFDSMDPVQTREGKVISVSPLRVQVSEKLILEPDEVMITLTVSRYIQSGELKAGDLVAAVRAQGGQKYFIMDKVMSNGTAT